MSSENRSIVFAALTGLGLLALTTPAFAHGPDAQGGSGASPGGNVPFSQQAPGQMMGGGMMGGQNGYGGMMGGGMMGGWNGYGGMMGTNPPATVPPCPGAGASPATPCGNQGSGGMTVPQGQMLPMTR